MPHDIHRAALYRGIINLWVEDELTREYLSALWNDSALAFFIAGGNDGVRAVVEDARKGGFPNVFGLIDGDFRSSNKEHWQNPSKTSRTFVLPAHEIENYLLDPPALAASRLNTLKKSEDQIEDHLKKAAAGLTWWAACRDVIAELKRRFRDNFLSDPPCSLADEAAATDHICTSAWFTKLPSACAQSTEDDVRRLLVEAHQTAVACLNDGSWRTKFAGKEIYHDVGSRICHRTKLPGYHPSQTEFDIDLAKDVAAWQSANRKPHPDLVELLAALRARIAGTPPTP